MCGWDELADPEPCGIGRRQGDAVSQSRHGFQEAGIRRYFCEIAIDLYATLRLNEGAAMRLFGPEEILASGVPMTPYDGFALWLHFNAKRLR